MLEMKLLNPGPVTLSQKVRSALIKPDLCHREIEFAEMQKDVIARINSIYKDAPTLGFETVLLSGSGTAAVEAMLHTFLNSNSKSLVVANGVYGERMAMMLKAQKKNFELIQSDWCAPLDLMEVEKRLIHSKKQGHAFTHILSIHHETTTGRLNDLSGLGKICKEYNVPLLLDAVSSFGGEWIDFENWNLQAIAATANKCLHGVPGICFVVAHKNALQTSEGNSLSVYLDLFKYWKEQKTSGFSPFTQAVQSLYALQAALEEFQEKGGWQKRNEHYQSLSRFLRKGLKEKGVSLLLPSEKDFSSILTSFYMPSGLNYLKMHDDLKANGFIIYAGQGKFNGEIFRIAVMGELTLSDMERLLTHL